MTAVRSKVLVVDDERPIRMLMRKGLAAQGYEIMEAPDGKTSLQLLAQKPVLVILDLGLPDIHGLDLLRMMRARDESVPIVVLSSRSDEAGKVDALDHGADDYVTKPFGMDELLARMRAALRHQLHVQGARPIFRVRDLSVDLVRRIVKVRDNEVKLSPKEYELLRVLVQHAGKVLTNRLLLTELWDIGTYPQYFVSTSGNSGTRSKRVQNGPITFWRRQGSDTDCGRQIEQRTLILTQKNNSFSDGLDSGTTPWKSTIFSRPATL